LTPGVQRRCRQKTTLGPAGTLMKQGFTAARRAVHANTKCSCLRLFCIPLHRQAASNVQQPSGLGSRPRRPFRPIRTSRSLIRPYVGKMYIEKAISFAWIKPHPPAGVLKKESVLCLLAGWHTDGGCVCGGRTTDLLFCAIHCTHSDQSSDKEEKHAIA
jgi:hypothetical protein